MCDNLTFSEALDALKKGAKLQRAGWNGKGMFLILVDPYSNDQYEVTEKEGACGTLLPYIAMKTVDNKLVPWLASQTDILMDDWSGFPETGQAAS